MSIFYVSRSLALRLIIVIFSFTFVQAQNSSLSAAKNAEQTAERRTKDESIASSELNGFAPPRNKPKFFGKASSAPDSTAEYKKQTATGSNKEWGVYGGSFTVHKDLRGESQRAPVVLFGIRHAWTTKNNPAHRLRYYIDVNPLIIVNYRQERLVQTSPTTTATETERKTVFGVGFVPVGIQFNWRNSKKYQPFIAGAFGVAVFNKKFPDNRSPLQPDRIGNRFQLMPEFGAGVEIRQTESKSYFIGYKYHHMSNGYTAPLNVGYNTNMVYGGMYFQRGK
jgi:L,D-peptidoglycan transpeptidase YkuD (ErfK/YbiS/YcfS/YnhG family)